MSNFMASQDDKISRFEANFKQYQSEMTNKFDTFLKAFNDQMTGALPSDTIKNPKLNSNSTSSARSYPTGDPQSSSNSFKSVYPETPKHFYASTNTHFYIQYPKLTHFTNRASRKVVQELRELQAISAYIDSRLANIDQIHKDFTTQPNIIDMDDVESNNGLTDTPLVSPFLDSDDDSDDGEVLNEQEEYGNVGKLCRRKMINSFARDDLAF
ncbi:hypothetical protein Tco_0144528 [Tanacetum coccineum]